MSKPKTLAEASANLEQAIADFTEIVIAEAKKATNTMVEQIKAWQYAGYLDENLQPTDKLKQLQEEAKNHEKN